MRLSRWVNISLATKCLLLFGAAVLAILTAALFVPLVRMFNLTDEIFVGRAREMASLAKLTSDLRGPTWWINAQDHLNQHWASYAKQTGLDPQAIPQFYPAESDQVARMFGVRGFKYKSLETLRQSPAQLFTYQVQDNDDHTKTIRLAMAIRAGHTEPHPDELKGLIYVEIQKPAEYGFYNVVVIVGAGLSGGLLAILVFYLVTQRLILSPVRDLRSVAERVTRGDLDVRSEIETGDEYQQLGNAFNDMLTHLQANEDELRTINRSLDTRLGELAERNVNLFEANKVKSEFLASVSHELRTPLVSIIGFAELLVDAAKNPPKDQSRPQRYAQNILTSGRMLLDMINDLLDLAKIEAGKIELHLSEFAARDICERLVDFVRPLAEKKNLQLHVDLEPDLPMMHSDAGRVQQILYNLVSNAIKFTPEGGRVTLHLASAGPEHLTLSVQDTGPGIPADKQSVIFEQFRQLDASATREYGGTGLGLAITRELCQLLGGTIRVESEQGAGANFIITLPFVSPREAERKLIGLT
jgi:signal transduction histidine kinase